MKQKGNQENGPVRGGTENKGKKGMAQPSASGSMGKDGDQQTSVRLGFIGNLKSVSSRVLMMRAME